MQSRNRFSHLLVSRCCVLHASNIWHFISSLLLLLVLYMLGFWLMLVISTIKLFSLHASYVLLRWPYLWSLFFKGISGYRNPVGFPVGASPSKIQVDAWVGAKKTAEEGLEWKEIAAGRYQVGISKEHYYFICHYFFMFTEWKKHNFCICLCRERKNELKCGCVGMEWRVRKMDGDREVHRPSRQIFSPQVLLWTWFWPLCDFYRSVL